MADQLDGLKKKLTAAKTPYVVPWDRGLSSGSTLLNLACTGRSNMAFIPGNFYYFVGDSSSGKTWFCFTLLAEATLNKHYQDHRFIFDNAENGALMDIKKYFGKAVAERMEAPERTAKGEPVYSDTVESFYYHVDDAFKAKKPFIYIIDSMDALSDDAELKKFSQRKAAKQKDEEIKGSYGMGKAKANSSGLRVIFNKLRNSDSILIMISQTRDRVGPGAMFNPRTRSGGRALTFYAALEIWTSVAGHIKTRHKGHNIEQGIYSKARVMKNRLSGKDRTIEVPLYHSFGIDDVGSCVSYLVEWKRWLQSGKAKEDDPTSGTITAKDFGIEGNFEKIVKQIQERGLEKDLRLLVAETWQEVEEACTVDRKSRYA